MCWNLAWADHVVFLESLQRQGQYIQALEEKPALYNDLLFVWDCFKACSRARQTGMAGVNPIAISEIRAWLEANGAQANELPEMIKQVQDLDAEWCRWITENKSDEKPQVEK